MNQPEMTGEGMKLLSMAGEEIIVACGDTIELYNGWQSVDYHSRDNPDAQPRKVDWDYLEYVTGNAVLETIVPVDATPSQERSYQRKRGQRMKGNKGGRPQTKKRPKKEFRVKWIETARRLKREGKSLRYIAKNIQARSRRFVSHATVQFWLRNDVKPVVGRY